MLIVAALVRDARNRTRIASALRTRATVVPCDEPVDIAPVVASARGAIVIADLRARSDSPVLPAIRKISAAYPFTPLVAHCPFDKPSVRRLLAAGAAGFTDVLFEDFDSAEDVFDSILARGETAEARARVARAIKPSLPLAAYEIVARTLKDLPKTPSVADLSASLGVSRRTLAHQLKHAGLPSYTRPCHAQPSAGRRLLARGLPLDHQADCPRYRIWKARLSSLGDAKACGYRSD